ncbi:hypothetical protein GOODEAATRI_011204 [Goodea atripinnis]|uniref:Uncharacterized protein n=1 Tax=Goodea atripinnis TaxID=208336 RepID=A0ABV0MR67_9TELE
MNQFSQTTGGLFAFTKLLSIRTSPDRETRVDMDAMTPDVTGVMQPAKLPITSKDIVNSKKVIAVRKEQKRKLGKQRSFAPSMDYSPLEIDKHEPEFVSSGVENPSVCLGLRPFMDLASVYYLLLYFIFLNCNNLKGYDLGFSPLLHFSKGSLSEKIGWDHPGNEGHFSSYGSLSVPSQL